MNALTANLLAIGVPWHLRRSLLVAQLLPIGFKGVVVCGLLTAQRK
jgi:hypothetical protein